MATVNSKKNLTLPLSRRHFLAATAPAIAACTILPRYMLGGRGYIPPSDRLNIAVIGSGGQGIHNIKGLFNHNDVRIIAVCDVNEESDYSRFYYGGTAGLRPALSLINSRYSNMSDYGPDKKCRGYNDFRRMFAKENDIDAVLIATPDHNHAISALAAIEAKKHVYCEKPLCRSIYETRVVTEASRKAGVATQMGNHGHSGEGIRLTVEWIRDGAIGPIRHIHAWTNAGRNTAPARRDRPDDTPPVPTGLDWRLWLGPVAERPYHPEYTPYNWRDWWAFANGALGDMACHNMDPAFWALELDAPDTVEGHAAKLFPETTPLACTVYYTFPQKGTRPPVTLTWTDGGIKPARPEELESYRTLGDNGILFVGDRGKILCGGWGGSPRIIPETKMKAYRRPAKSIKRVKGHHRDWINACKGGDPASSNFDYSGPLTEAVLLGTVAMRTGKKLIWDGIGMKAVNAPEADHFIHPEYHNGWTI